MNVISLKELIAPVYYEEYKFVKANKFTYYWNQGGRSSAKSSFISLCIALGLKRDTKAHAAILMKVGDKMEDMVVQQMKWALEMLQQIYPNYELYKETELPFEGYLGVELFNWTESNDKFPSVWFGEAFLTNSIDLLYAYDHAYTCKENDKYLGRGRAIVPAQFNPQDGIGLNRSVQTQIQRGQTLGSMTNAFNQSKMRPPLDNTFYDEIYFNGEVSKPEKIQFDLRSDQWRIELDGTLGDIASRLHISAVDLDARVNGATQRTATEINKDSDITITTASTKQIQFTNGLNELIKAYLEVKGLDTSNIDSFVEWPPSGIANPQVATTVFTTQVMNGLLSKYTAIHKLNPEWTDEEVKEELERIDSESTFTPDFTQDKDVI